MRTLPNFQIRKFLLQQGWQMAGQIYHLFFFVFLLVLCVTTQQASAYSAIGCFKGLSHGKELHSLCTTDWNRYEEIMQSIASQCNAKAKAEGLLYFGIHDLCHCSAVPNFDADEAMTATQCYTPTHDICGTVAPLCYGSKVSSYVYKSDLQITTTSTPVTTPNFPRKNTVDGICTKKLDIGIAIDASSSIVYSPLWDYSKSLVKSLINSTLIGSSNVQLSIMTFGTTAKMQVAFKDRKNADDLKRMAHELYSYGGFTRTDLALQLAKTEMFSSANGMREDARKIFMLITNGNTVGMDATIKWSDTIIVPALNLRSSDVQIFAVALGQNAPYSELQKIASDPVSNHVLNISDFHFPNATGKRLAGMLCGDSFANVAFGKSTLQSSTFSSSYGKSSLAVDGNVNKNENYCTRTKEESNPWWQVDLGEEMEIFQVKIYNRGDCCGWWLVGSEIRVGSSLENNGNDNPVCRKNIWIGTGEEKTFVCRQPLKGRFVNIRIPGNNRILSFCEVEAVARAN